MNTTEDYRIVETDEDGEVEFTPAEYGYMWIKDCCLMHQWCSGARAIDQEVVDYAESLLQRVADDLALSDNPNWKTQDADNLSTLLRYLKANMRKHAEQKDGEFISPCTGTTYTYSELKEAHPENYPFSVVGTEAWAVADAFIAGIDSHLEACFVEARGDTCENHQTIQIATLNDQAVCCPNCGTQPNRITMSLSPESLAVLLRRLTERGNMEDAHLSEAADGLAGDILYTIFHED